MDDEQSTDVVNEFHGEPPAVTVSYGVFEVSVFGGPGDTLEDIEGVAERRVETAMNDIENLKRMDYDLNEEYDGGETTSRMSH